MMNEEQYIAMMREDMKENFTMSFRNRPSQISVPRALFDKMTQIAADLHCARNKAIKLVTQLEDAGLITRVKAEHYHPNRYYIHNITEDKNE